MVKSPTRGNSVLDQLLTNMSDILTSAQHLPPLGRSDHQCLVFKPKKRVKLPPVTKKVRQMNPRNLDSLQVAMNNESWETVIKADNVSEKVSVFNNIIGNILNTVMPERSVRIHPTDKPWITPSIKVHIKKRQNAYTVGNSLEYDALCIKVKNLISKAKYKYYQDKAKNNKYHNPAKWYSSIYKLAGASNPQSTLTAPTSEELQELSEKLQEAFTAPWKDPNSMTTCDVCEVQNLLKDHNPPIPSIGQVKSALAYLNTKKATGADGIPAWFLKRFAEELAVVVHDIFKASIIQCEYPRAYKHALISPVPKVIPPEDILNDFRQISVLPHLGKVLERIQLKLQTHDLQLNNTQHAFTPNRSTVSALISITQNWFDVTDNNRTSGYKGVHAIFIDFKKAFDKVDHRILLLMKLAEHNINKSFWKWIKSFLSQRTQQVKIQICYQQPHHVLRGSRRDQ